MGSRLWNAIFRSNKSLDDREIHVPLVVVEYTLCIMLYPSRFSWSNMDETNKSKIWFEICINRMEYLFDHIQFLGCVSMCTRTCTIVEQSTWIVSFIMQSNFEGRCHGILVNYRLICSSHSDLCIGYGYLLFLKYPKRLIHYSLSSDDNSWFFFIGSIMHLSSFIASIGIISHFNWKFSWKFLFLKLRVICTKRSLVFIDESLRPYSHVWLFCISSSSSSPSAICSTDDHRTSIDSNDYWLLDQHHCFSI